MKGFIYIITNQHNTVLYVGVTSDLKDRISRHSTKRYPDSFSARYNLCKLVYFEELDTIGEAIKREKQIKAGSRHKKIELICELNPDWKDLFTSL
jgi:putative endonuclease